MLATTILMAESLGARRALRRSSQPAAMFRLRRLSKHKKEFEMKKLVLLCLALGFMLLSATDVEARGHRGQGKCGLGKGKVKAFIAKIVHRR